MLWCIKILMGCCIGDELLRIDISVVPEMSLDVACTILRAAGEFPVRLTLLRQRHETSDAKDQSTVVDMEQDRSPAEDSSRLGYVGAESSWTSSPDYVNEPPLVAQSSRWRPDGGRTDGEVFDGRRRPSQSSSDDGSDRDLAPMPVGSVSGPAAGVHSTYLDLLAVVPPAQSSSSDLWNDKDSLEPPAAFLKTQSSPTFGTTLELPTSRMDTSSTQGLATQSVDELYTYVRRTESSDVHEEEDLGGSGAVPSFSADSTYAMDDELDVDGSTLVASSHNEVEPDLENNHGHYDVPDSNDRTLYNGNAEPFPPTPVFAERSNGVPSDGDEPAYVNHSNVYLQQASDGRQHAGQPLRTAVEDADLGGVERALRAPERSATGGMTYYINLEDHHFRGFPGQLDDDRAHSANDWNAS